jgi:hypothetical protein
VWILDLALSALLLKLGRVRIIEVAVPMGTTKHSSDSGKAMVETLHDRAARFRGNSSSTLCRDGAARDGRPHCSHDG